MDDGLPGEIILVSAVKKAGQIIFGKKSPWLKFPSLRSIDSDNCTSNSANTTVPITFNVEKLLKASDINSNEFLTQ